MWAEHAYGARVPMPEFWIVGHGHMQDTAKHVECFNEINGQVFGWFKKDFPDRVFISDKVKMTNKNARAIIVHELIHYIQYHAESKLESIDELEAEADLYMDQYIKSA